MSDLVECLAEAPETLRPVRSDADRLALLKQYLPLVRHVAGKYHSGLARFHDYEDLLAIGQLAIWKCTVTFREDLGTSFTSYGYMALVHRFELLRRDGRSKKRQGIEWSMDETDESDRPRHEYAGPDPLQDALLENQEGKILLEGLLGRLSSRERSVIEERFVQERTLESIAGEWGVSRERIRQIEMRAVRKLRLWLLPHYPESRGGPRPVSSSQARPLVDRQISQRRRALPARKVASDPGSG